MAKCVQESDGHTRPHCTSLGWMSIIKGSELRLVRTACLIEMHFRSAPPAESEPASIVHNPAAIDSQGDASYSTASKVPLKKTKDDNRSNSLCFLSFLSNKTVLITSNWPTHGSLLLRQRQLILVCNKRWMEFLRKQVFTKLFCSPTELICHRRAAT